MPNSKSQFKSNKSVAKKQETIHTVQVRHLTVSYLSVERERLTFDTYQNRNRVPFLKLSGQWLEDAGFSIASKVSIIVRDNLLIVENQSTGS